MKLNNPFFIPGYCSRGFFCGREQETGAIVNVLRNGHDLAGETGNHKGRFSRGPKRVR